VIEISNKARDIASGDVEKLFDSFFRGNNARTNTEEGSGLGLSIAKAIIEKHGGEIYAKKNADKLAVIIEI